MGREAQCQCIWAGESGQCKVLLETAELIVRGAFRRVIPISSMTYIAVDGDNLTFCVGADKVALTLGAAQARSWAKKLTTAPPTLASKLGISSDSQLLLIGESDSEELNSALAGAATRSSTIPGLIVACAHTRAELDQALHRATAYSSKPPIWIVYPKGAGTPLPESVIRNTLRSQGFIDTKVASVDATYTALRFIKRT